MRKAKQSLVLAMVAAAGIAVAVALSGEPDAPADDAPAATPETAPVTGKGPGMGRQYKENVPDAGRGSPEHRGGSTDTETDEEGGDDGS